MSKYRKAKGYADGWDSAGANGDRDPLAPHNQPQAPRRKKDTRTWCRGKVGVEHRKEIQFDTRATSKCRPSMWSWGDSWWCNHHEVCGECGKITRSSVASECPDRPSPALV